MTTSAGPIRRGTYAADGVALHYAETAGQGPAVVLIHGLTDSLDAYLPCALRLASRHRVFALDLRGHGDSGHVSGRYRVADYADDVEQFLEDVVRTPAVLAGCSLGGLIVTCLAARAPALVAGALLEDPPLYIASMPALAETPYHGWFIEMREILLEHHRASGSVEQLFPRSATPS